MLLKTKPLTLAVWRALGIAGSASLFLLATDAIAADAADASQTASGESAVVANTDSAATPQAASADKHSKDKKDKKDGKQAKSRQLETVVVTAQRRKENPQKVPSAITAISGETLIDSGVGREANDIMQYVPNASAATSGGHTRPRWWIRGVGSGTQGLDSPSPVGVYQDDVYISNANATAGPIYDLDHVEILRGPQGTLWGKNTTGGAINFVSKRPSFDNDGYAKLDVGSHGSTIVEGAVGGAVVDQTVAARASFHDEDTDGGFHDATLGNKAVGIKDTSARVQFLAKLGDDGEALLNVHERQYRGTGDNAAVIGTGVGGAYWNAGGLTYIPNSTRYAVSTNAPTYTNIDQNGIDLNLKWRLPHGLELTSITAYEAFKQNSQADSDNTPIELSRSWTQANSNQFSQEFRLASPRETWGNWVTGLHYFNENINSNAATGTLPTGQTPAGRNIAYSNTFFKQATESYAIFGSTTFNITDAFSVATGLRWSTEEKDINFKSYSLPAGAVYNNQTSWWLPSSVTNYPTTPVASQLASNTWSDFTYDVTPEYRLTEHQRVYLKYAKGFRGGGYNTGATTQSAISTLSPEFLTSYEAGYKSEWLDGRLNFNANVFHYIYDDMQINAVVPSPTGPSSQLRNAAKGGATGAEFELDSLITSNLRFHAGLGLLDAKFKDFKDVNGNYSGNHFVRAPKASSVAGLEYTIPLRSGNDVVLATDWTYTTRQFFYSNNQTDPNLQQAGYGLGNVRASYVTAGKKLTLTTYLNNVTDQLYKQHALPGTSGATGDSVYYGDGRTGGVAVTVRW